jgi:hypothetical protein
MRDDQYRFLMLLGQLLARPGLVAAKLLKPLGKGAGCEKEKPGGSTMNDLEFHRADAIYVI